MNLVKKSKENLLEFNYLRAIGIFLVVLGHSFPFIDEINISSFKYVHSLIYSFHMPLFIMISGFFAYKIMSIKSFGEYKIFVLNKFSRLIIPYFTISLFTIPIKFLLNKFSERPLVLSEVLIDIIFYPWRNPIIFFWFIYALFIIFVFSPIIVKFNKYIVLGAFLFLYIIPKPNIEFMGINSILTYSIFFFTGIYLRDFYMKNRAKFLNLKLAHKNIILIFIIPTLIFLINFQFPNYENAFLQILINIFYFFKSLLGIYVCFIISILLCRFKEFKSLKLISEYSFDIYLLSWFSQIFCRIIFYQILNLNYLVVVILSLICGFLPIVISKFLLRKFYIFRKFILGIN